MNKTTLGLIAVVALMGTPVLAADMATKAPPPAPIRVVADWTGLTLDADIGWMRNSYTWLYSNFPGEIQFPLSNDNTVFGAHVGAQYQFANTPLVVGAEFGISDPVTKNYASVTSIGVVSAPCGTGGAGPQCQTLASTIDTYGGKLGYAWQNWLLYAEGGGASGKVKSQLTFGAGLGIFDTGSSTNNGYYVGGGFDYMLFKASPFDVIGGLEYEHIALGTVLEPSSADGFNPAGVNARMVSAREDILWAKLTLKLNPWGK